MPLLTLQPDEFDLLRRLIYDHCGIWLADDKATFLQVRVDERMRARLIQTARDYYYFLKYDPHGGEELQQLVDAVAVKESWFFRETEPLEVWRDKILPDLLNRTNRVRVWSAACSTGEEPYTVAMMLLEWIGDTAGVQFEVIATDVSSQALAVARAGIYDAHSLRRTEPRWLTGYFHPGADRKWVIADKARRLVRFSQGNLLDPRLPQRVGMVDMILCRNVLIYFNDQSRRAALNNLYTALKPGGHLLLGFSESLTLPDILFDVARVEGTVLYRKPALHGAMITEGFFSK